MFRTLYGQNHFFEWFNVGVLYIGLTCVKFQCLVKQILNL